MKIARGHRSDSCDVLKHMLKLNWLRRSELVHTLIGCICNLNPIEFSQKKNPPHHQYTEYRRRVRFFLNSKLDSIDVSSLPDSIRQQSPNKLLWYCQTRILLSTPRQLRTIDQLLFWVRHTVTHCFMPSWFESWSSNTTDQKASLSIQRIYIVNELYRC